MHSKIVLYGSTGPCDGIDFFRVHCKALSIIKETTEMRGQLERRRLWREGMQLVADGLLPIARLRTHLFPIGKLPEATARRNSRPDRKRLGARKTRSWRDLVEITEEAPQDYRKGWGYRGAEPGSAGASPSGKAAPLNPARSYRENHLAVHVFGSARAASGREAGLQSRPCLLFVEARINQEGCVSDAPFHAVQRPAMFTRRHYPTCALLITCGTTPLSDARAAT